METANEPLRLPKVLNHPSMMSLFLRKLSIIGRVRSFGNSWKIHFLLCTDLPTKNMFSIRASSGIWVISKIPLTKIEEIEYNNRIGIDAMARKGAVMFQGEWYGKEFQLVGTHLQNDSPDEVRHEQCQEIYQKLLHKYYNSEIPQFVCGDFNIEMGDSSNYNYMLKSLNAENGILEGDLNVSFDEIDNQLAKRPNGRKQLIDYILVRNGRLIESIRRRVSIFHGYNNDAITDLSDHYGIEATIFFGSAPFNAL
jgi:endonuclease/exonuclease/phosphatase family metal-dependent hydrolase